MIEFKIHKLQFNYPMNYPITKANGFHMNKKLQDFICSLIN